MTVTRDSIVEAITEQTGFRKNQSFVLVDTLAELIKKTLESGEDVLVSGFGKFRVKRRRNGEAGIRLLVMT